MEILTGVHELRGSLGSNVYLVVDGDQLALVDSGFGASAQKVLSYIRGLGRSLEELSTIILTHSHPDHTGGLRLLRRATPARVLAHGRDVKYDAEGRPWLYYSSQPLALEWDVPFFQKLYPDGLVRDGQVLPLMGGMEVLHTPGHTPGSIVLYLRERGVLFTGDTLLSNGKAFRRPFSFPGTNLRAYRRSIERLSRLEFDVACTGHGRALVGGAQAKVNQMLQNYFWATTWGRVLRGLTPGARGRIPSGAN